MSEPHNSCKCFYCTKVNRVKEYLWDVAPQDVKDIFVEIMDKLEAAETDVGMYQGIMAGWWPGAEDKLNHALDNIKSKEK